MFKFKIGDEVVVTSGRDKGKGGKIAKVLVKEAKLVVEGVNIYKRHKKVSAKSPAGIYQVARPIPTAAVAIVCPKCGKPTRVTFTTEGKTKYRVCKKCHGRLTSKEAL